MSICTENRVLKKCCFFKLLIYIEIIWPNLSISTESTITPSTNYWESEHAISGYCFLSWNAGSARLLVPALREQWLKEMSGAKYVVVSRGPWHEHGGRDALELMFEDDSDAPFCLHLVAEQCDRLLPEADQGGGFVVAVWTQNGKRLRLPGKYRQVQAIPCLEPWVVQ